VLAAPPVVLWRSRSEQVPDNREHLDTLRAIHAHFPRKVAHKFEAFAKWIVERMDQNVGSIDLTRRWRDGGRDGLGDYRIGPPGSAITVSFALEAKCYDPDKNSVGVKELSRLISRLRHRQFGVLVTTSWVDRQAYKEVTDDGHPVVIIAGKDLIELLPANLRSAGAIQRFLEAGSY
jgi:hypothetical protein